MLTNASLRLWRRRKNSMASGRVMDSTRRRVPWQQGHLRGSTAHTDWMRSRQSGRMARAVVFSGGGMKNPRQRDRHFAGRHNHDLADRH